MLRRAFAVGERGTHGLFHRASKCGKLEQTGLAPVSHYWDFKSPEQLQLGLAGGSKETDP